jgi:hypothetical protein
VAWKQFTYSIAADKKVLTEYDFEKVRKDLADLQKIVEKISFGDVISDEDF